MFITFEGGEGSGKSSILKKVKERFEKLNIKFIITREPGGKDNLISEAIRSVILNPEHKNMTYKTEALLFAASRHQHIMDTILPALNRNDLVICDRYLDSSLVYQGYARNLPMDYILKINDFALDFLPDLTVIFDVDPKLGLSRVSSRGKVDRLDQEKISFYQKVREGYFLLKDKFPERKFLYLDSSKTLDEVFDELMKHLENYVS